MKNRLIGILLTVVMTITMLPAAGSIVYGEENVPESGNGIEACSLSYNISTYDGKTKNPKLTVTGSGGKELVRDTDYTVDVPSGRKNVGKYIYTINLKGDYSGTKSLSLIIKPNTAAINSIIAGSGKITVKTSEKPSATGGSAYQIAYKQKGAKAWSYVRTTSHRKTIKSLMGGRRYYVKVRAYKKVDSAAYYGNWSSLRLSRKTGQAVISPLVTYIDITRNKSKGRGGSKIDKIFLHHMAGNCTVRQCGDLFKKREASAHYGVNGKNIGCYVKESDTAWHCANSRYNRRSIGIELANDLGASGNWHVADQTIETTIKLLVDICKRNGIKKLKYTGSLSGNLCMHSWVYNKTICPGPYLKSRFKYIASEVNKKLVMDPGCGL